jgi:3-oxoacyl-[acyl-carrier-protein] synthase II
VPRVVITGLGTVNPCGHGVSQTWDNVTAGRSGIDRISRFDATDWPVQIAGEVRDWNPADHLDRRSIKRMDRFMQFAMVASMEATSDAGLEAGENGLGDRAGVFIGTGIGGLAEIVKGADAYQTEGHRGLTPFFIPRALTNLAAGHVAMRLGARGPSLCVSTSCATGNHSIGEAWRYIRSGDADIMIAGGAEAAILPVGISGFMVMRALSKRNDDPQTASRPFDKDRDGFVMGEGAGIVVLESLEHARARGARIYCELVGYGLTNDAHHITQPAPGHAGAVRCMQLALRSAGMTPDQVDCINAHGTSTPQNDFHETQALKTVFGEHAHKLAVSATKSMTGHLLGAAGGLEAVLATKTISTGIIPPTATLQTADEGCDLDYVQGQARQSTVQAVLSNAFGFGGTNASLLFKRIDD